MGEPVPRPRLIVASLPGPGERIRLAGEEAAHARARRLEEGSAVVLIDGSGREAAARVVRMGRRGCELRVESLEDSATDAAPPLHLLVAAIRAERLGWLGEKAAELGAARLTVVASERTQAFRARDGMLARLQRIVRESAKQAAASRFTAVDGPLALADALAAASGTRLLLDPGGAPFPDRLPAAPVSILVGPEGGLTDAERSAAVAAGWRAVALPAGVVRAETAAIAAIVLARAALLRKP